MSTNRKKIWLDEIDYNDINSNPYFNQANYAKPQKVNNSYKPSKTTKNSSVGAGEYAVQKGDSLWKIAKEHGTTVQALRDANPEIKGNMIYANQIINLGSKSTQTSKPTNKQQAQVNKTTTKQTNKTTTTKNTSEQPRLATVNTNLNGTKRFDFTNYVDIDYEGNVLSPMDHYNIDKAIHLDHNMEKLTGRSTFNEIYDAYKNPKGTDNSSSTSKPVNNFDIQKEIRKRNLIYRTQDNLQPNNSISYVSNNYQRNGNSVKTNNNNDKTLNTQYNNNSSTTEKTTVGYVTKPTEFVDEYTAARYLLEHDYTKKDLQNPNIKNNIIQLANHTRKARERPDYEGVRRGMIAAALAPVLPIAAENLSIANVGLKAANAANKTKAITRNVGSKMKKRIKNVSNKVKQYIKDYNKQPDYLDEFEL